MVHCSLFIVHRPKGGLTFLFTSLYWNYSFIVGGSYEDQMVWTFGVFDYL